MHADRLLILAANLEAKPTEPPFDFRSYVGKGWKDAQDLSCGTTACAVGRIPLIPEFRAYVRALRYRSIEGYSGEVVLPVARDENGIEVEGIVLAQYLFDLSRAQVRYLFIEDAYGSPLGDTATAPQVAAHIHRFVEADGNPQGLCRESGG